MEEVSVRIALFQGPEHSGAVSESIARIGEWV